MGRYREYGNDLIPFLVGSYFLIKILSEKLSLKNITKLNLFSFFPIYSTFMISHKVTYVLSSLIFFSIISKKNIFFALKQKYLIIFFILFTSLWLGKNYIETSCLIYPVLETCFKNSGWYLSGMADPKKAMWLSEIWAKGFIDHPEWQNLNLEDYIVNFNWFSTWLSNHFVKILEKISPLILIMLITSFYILLNRKNFNDSINYKKPVLKKLIFVLILIGIGLLVWFIKSPLFRYGTFYLISFIVLTFLVVNYRIIEKLSFLRIQKLKILFFISLIFFLTKNINRQINSENTYFPLTKPHSDNYEIIYNQPKIIKPKKEINVCYLSDYICSHEAPTKFQVLKKKNFLLIK